MIVNRNSVKNLNHCMHSMQHTHYLCFGFFNSKEFKNPEKCLGKEIFTVRNIPVHMS